MSNLFKNSCSKVHVPSCTLRHQYCNRKYDGIKVNYMLAEQHRHDITNNTAFVLHPSSLSCHISDISFLLTVLPSNLADLLHTCESRHSNVYKYLGVTVLYTISLDNCNLHKFFSQILLGFASQSSFVPCHCCSCVTVVDILL